VRSNSDSLYQLAILVDTDGHYANPSLLDRYLMQPSILKAFGWRFALVLTKDWYHTPEDVLARLEKLLQGQEVDAGIGLEEKEADLAAPDAGGAAFMPLQPQPDSSSGKVSGTQHDATVKRPEGRAPDETDPVTPAVSLPSSVRYFEFVVGASRKFWEISITGNSFTVRFGRIGTAGQSQTKAFAKEEKAQREAESLIAEKVKKGYLEKHG
jgi:predicted DNA-binding WGR domain protein